MSEIDWKIAPDWATGYGLIIGGFGIEGVWFDAEKYLPLRSQEGYGPYPFGGGTGPERHNATIGEIQFKQHRPAPWSGEGLPPVGADVECTFAVEMHEIWHRGTVVHCATAPEGDQFVVVDTGEVSACYRVDGTCLRPYRTPEQIAADERLHNVRNACTAIADTLDGLRGKTKIERAALAVVEAMIDAGYTKGAP